MPTSRRHYRVRLADALVAHDLALMFGGLAGIRDLGSIEAAIARPYSGYYRSVTQKAAALVHSLALNHGFVDGNKRTALLVTSLFLRRSGYKLDDRDSRRLDADVEQMILAVVEHRMTFDEIIAWFTQRVVRNDRRSWR